MGYDVHVFRGEDWTNPERVERSDWDRFLASVEGVQLIDHVEATTPTGDVIRLEGAFLEWSGHSSGQPIPLSVSVGESVTMKNPDDEGIQFLVELAAKLRGRVQGDEGEFYNGTPRSEPTDRYRVRPRSGRDGRRWFGRRHT